MAKPPDIPDPSATIISPCGKWQAEWWMSSLLADSYNSIEIVVMSIMERATGLRPWGQTDFNDTSLRPVRFLGEGRLLLYSLSEEAYLQYSFRSAEPEKLVRPEDAEDDYAPIVMSSAPSGVWVIRGLFGSCSVIALLVAAASVYDRSIGLAVSMLVVAVSFALLAAWLSTERQRQVVDLVQGTVEHDIQSCLHVSKTSYQISDFDRVERRRYTTKGIPYFRSRLAGKRVLQILEDKQAELICRRLSLPLQKVGF